jgi:site-specific DNA-methyltransferase (adenine-specific)
MANTIEELEKLHIKIEYVDIEKLKPYEKNARSWSDKQTADLTESLTRFTLLEPLVINMAKDREFTVLSGNFRLSVARKLGYKTLPVIKVFISDSHKEAELVLRFNANVGSWRYDILKDFQVELLMDVGFTDTELSHIWDSQIEVEDDDFNEVEEIKKIQTPTSKQGELYSLGDHLLFVGNSSDPETIQKLTKNKKVSLMICDPIFNINLDYDKGLGKKSKYGGKVNDKKTDEEYKEFLKSAMINGLSVCLPDTHIFYFCDQSYVWLIQTLYKELGITNRRVCLWVKNNQNPTPQVAFSKAYEPCVYGTIGSPYLSPLVTNLNEFLDKEIGTGNKVLDDIADMFEIWLAKRLPTAQYTHPTTKPPTIYEKVLKRCSKPGDYVLDLYAGSAPLLVAAEQLHRKALLVEIDPVFVDLILKRYEHLTGKKAIKLN